MSTNGMNRPGTIINWHDQVTSTNVIEEKLVRPLYLQLFTSDKGPETLRTVHGNDFFNLYGSTPSFKKHGQPLLQAAEIVKAGGEILCKRVVASDATLANLVVVAKVSNASVQKFDASGKALYIDADTGKETTDAAGGLNERAMVNVAKVKYDAVSVSGAKTLTEVMKYAETLVKDEVDAELLTSYDTTTKVGDPLTDENPVGQVKDTEDQDYGQYVYPLFVVVDNGRGVSSKRFKITPDYTVSKANSFQLYKLNFIGDTATENEYVWFNFRNDVIYLGKSMSLDMVGKDLVQIKASSFADSIELFVKRLAAITGIDEAELNGADPIFGMNRKGEAMSQIVIDEEGYILNSELGMMLQNGSNGAFGDAPIKAASYADEMVKVLDGTFDDSIFDLDRFMIDVCVDANYPVPVKQAIFELAEFRQDFVYLRDYGTNFNSYEGIVGEYYNMPKSKFVCDYPQYWDVIDPWTRKQITVSQTYSMATKLVSHLTDRRSAPACGILYDFTFPNVVEGSVSFLPKITPKVDQKTLLSDMNINYASYINGVLTMETCYTSREGIVNNQMRWLNNILAVTTLIHTIRTEGPKFRYSFITDTDLDKYQEDVNNVIKRSNIDFATIYMQYTQDEVMEANKIFEADIFVKFKNFTQEEIFNIYTLS